MFKKLLLIAALSLPLFASATNLSASSCSSQANDAVCLSIPNDSNPAVEIDFSRKVAPQVYLGGGLYQPAYEYETVTVDGTSYSVKSQFINVVKTPITTTESDWHYSGVAFSDTNQPMPFDVYLHQHIGHTGGRVSRAVYQWSFLHGTVQ